MRERHATTYDGQAPGSRRTVRRRGLLDPERLRCTSFTNAIEPNPRNHDYVAAGLFKFMIIGSFKLLTHLGGLQRPISDK